MYQHDATPTWPDFEITVIHGPDGVEYVRATIEGRLCNVHYREAKYIAGETKPRFPVPAIREYCCIWHDYVIWSRPSIPMVSGYLSKRIRKD